jgi:hypothetical protein
MDEATKALCYEIIGRISVVPIGKRSDQLEQELLKLPADDREIARAWITVGTAEKDPEIMALKGQLEKTTAELKAEKMNNKTNWPAFIIGCILLAAAIAAFFWAFSLESLSPSRRFLLLWILPLASGFACLSFAGSIKANGPIGTIAVGATGGFAVWLLTFFGLPAIPAPTVSESSVANANDPFRIEPRVAAETELLTLKNKQRDILASGGGVASGWIDIPKQTSDTEIVVRATNKSFSRGAGTIGIAIKYNGKILAENGASESRDMGIETMVRFTLKRDQTVRFEAVGTNTQADQKQVTIEAYSLAK